MPGRPLPTPHPFPAKIPPRRRRQGKGPGAGSGPPLHASAPPRAAHSSGLTGSGRTHGPPDGLRDGRMYEAPRGEFARTPALAPPSLLHCVPASRARRPWLWALTHPDGSAAPRTRAPRPDPSRGEGARAQRAVPVGEMRSLRLAPCGGLGIHRQVPPPSRSRQRSPPLPPALSRCFTTARRSRGPVTTTPSPHHPFPERGRLEP